ATLATCAGQAHVHGALPKNDPPRCCLAMQQVMQTQQISIEPGKPASD
ncbi:hypothetical protein ALQ88_01970, partial [Pseudomonas savastanoi]